MSGYLEIKYPFKANLALNPFKSWKRQWCILRPSGTMAGGSLAVYCSEAGAAAGSVALPARGSVRRTKSSSRPHAFGVYSSEERKPCILLAAHTHQDAQVWMEKIRALIKGDHLFDTGLLQDSFSITIIPTELSRKCSLPADVTATIAPSGLVVTKGSKVAAAVDWKHLSRVKVEKTDGNQTCVVSVDGDFRLGPGELRLSTPLAGELCALLTQPDRLRRDSANEHEDTSRSSWSSDPSESSLDDLHLLDKESCATLPRDSRSRARATHRQSASFDDSLTDRRSMLSIASGIYEEIADVPDPLYCRMYPERRLERTPAPEPTSNAAEGQKDEPDSCLDRLQGTEPTYESVSECVYATMRRQRRPPPPLPPRTPFGTLKPGNSWNSRLNQDSGVIRHSSLGSLHSLESSATDPGLKGKRQPFNVFRKRLKSDSRLVTSPTAKAEAKENKLSTSADTKKKKFDFQPTRDIFKNFKVSRKMKNLKLTNLASSETKSCECLDEPLVTPNRQSKSLECLEDDLSISIEFNDDAVAALALPQEIIDIIVKGRETRLRRLQEVESHYLPMSSVLPSVSISPSMEHHYTVMAPKSKV